VLSLVLLGCSYTNDSMLSISWSGQG
jgi:hypothetical protein